MSTAIAEKRTTQLARPPSALVPLIRAAISAVDKSKQEIADLLAEARVSFDTFSEFLGWANRHFGYKETQATQLLSVGRYRQNDPAAARLPSLNATLRAMGHSRPTTGRVTREWQPDVDAIAERARREQDRISRAAEEELTRKQEREAQRELSLRIIDIGYKVLAKELHPDKGGSREMMARLNRARDHLKQMA